MKNKDIITPNNLSKDTKVSMRTRIISAIVGLAICLPCIIFGDVFFAALALFCLVVANTEAFKVPGKKMNIVLSIVLCFFSIVLAFSPVINNAVQAIKNESFYRIFVGFSSINISLISLAAIIFILFLNVIIDENFSIQDGAIVFLMIVTVAFGIQCVLYLRNVSLAKSYVTGLINTNVYYDLTMNVKSVGLVIYILVGSFMSDIGAYFIGVFFGKHKMNERISPKKTWEGFVGGIVISMIASFVTALIFDVCGAPILEGILDLEHFYNIVIISLVMPFVAVLGDLAFSAIKRAYGVKDYGKIMPGHGGVLDRIDSVIFVVIAVAVIVFTISKGII